MNDFTASNGRRITTDSSPGAQWPVTVVGLGLIADSVDALREFFRHEEDERLGRWRWPDNPEYIVHDRGDYVQVVYEPTGSSGMLGMWTRGEITPERGNLTGYGEAARAYFAAHPEPKPGDEAVEGEYWALRFSNWDVEVLCKRTPDGWKHEGKKRHPVGRYFGTPTAARRIWPEATS